MNMIARRGFQTALAGVLFILGSAVLLRAQPETNNAAPLSYADYAQVLASHVDNKGLVNYKDLMAHPELLNRFVGQIATLKPPVYYAWPEKEKIAFWINVYNALTLKSIIDNYPIKTSGGLISSLRFPKNSIRQIPGVWDKATHTVMDKPMTLDGIEHQVLRKQFKEPRIHMALVCAAKGCPPLRNEPYTGARLDAQLDDQAKIFFANPEKFRIDRNAKKVYLSMIFKWFGADFKEAYPTGDFQKQEAGVRPVLQFASQHLSPQDADYLKSGDYKISYLNYDWALNEQTDARASLPQPKS